MSSDAELHCLYQIANAPVREFPYPHVYVRDVFPADFYAQMLRNLPPESQLKTLRALKRVSGNYPDTRLVLPLTKEHTALLDEEQRKFWDGVGAWMLGGNFGQIMIAKFAPYLQQRFGNLDTQRFSDEVLVVRDYTTYSLGPHTDAAHKVLSFLFYLPADESMADLGTSMYLPKDRTFQCPGGPHYDFERFDRLRTMPYVPNALFAFMKTPNSFHGVEPITATGIRRDLMLYDIRVLETPAAPPAPGTSVKFSM